MHNIGIVRRWNGWKAMIKVNYIYRRKLTPQLIFPCPLNRIVISEQLQGTIFIREMIILIQYEQKWMHICSGTRSPDVKLSYWCSFPSVWLEWRWSLRSHCKSQGEDLGPSISMETWLNLWIRTNLHAWAFIQYNYMSKI